MSNNRKNSRVVIVFFMVINTVYCQEFYHPFSGFYINPDKNIQYVEPYEIGDIYIVDELKKYQGLIKKNKIKMIKREHGLSDEVRRGKVYYYFDNIGRLTLTIDSISGDFHKLKYQYNDDKLKSVLQDDTISYYYYYDDKGRLKKHVEISKSDTLTQNYYYYDSIGRILKFKYVDKDYSRLLEYKYTDTILLVYKNGKFKNKYVFNKRKQIVRDSSDIGLVGNYFYLNNFTISNWHIDNEEDMSLFYYENSRIKNNFYIRDGDSKKAILSFFEYNKRGMIAKEVRHEMIDGFLYGHTYIYSYSYSYW